MDYTSHPLLLLAGVFTVGSIARLLFHNFSVKRSLRVIPGPKSSSLLWGEERVLYHSEPGSQYTEWHREYGTVHQALSIIDPRAITYILGEGVYSFPKPDGVRAWFKATLGEGIIWTEGKELHERQRRLLAPALSRQSVRALTPLFYDTSSRLVASWCKLVENGQTDHAEIEVTSWAGRFALDTVIVATFSYNPGFLSGDHQSLLAALDGLTNNENKLSSFYMRALFWIFPSILSIGEKGEMIRKTKSELGEIASRMWRDAKVADDIDRRDLMSHMLRATSESGGTISEEEAVAQMRSIISAGYETVSALIAWVLYELAIHPDVQTRLRQDILTSGSSEMSMDDLNTKLPFLDAVIKETLRLHPPINENHHQAAVTVSVPLSSPLPGSSESQIVIPKGTIIAIPVNVIHTDPAVYGCDAHLFKPERWMERQKLGIRNEREIFAFSEGPRACIGRDFALTEIKVLVMTLLRQFSLSCERDIESFQSFVVRPRIKREGISSLPLVVRKL
ncbi:cytochrome P450 [Marasmius fiardii PR-910]|nr:cytochrome P450 [Marasmius fiardii PR-910]